MKFIVNGTFSSYAEKILEQKDYYIDYTGGKISSAQFRDAMLADADLADIAAGFSSGNIVRIAKMPPNERMPAEGIMESLLYGGFDEYRKNIYANYNHGEFITYVYPEDERLMYAAAKLARISKPENMKVFVAGSYYGYLAVWAMRVVCDSGGFAVLSDIDEEVCRLARENFKNLGLQDSAGIYCEDASSLLAERGKPEAIDMLVLDATGRGDDARPDFRGKRIYGALLREAKPFLRKGSVIYIHNMEPENPEMKMLVDELRAVNALGGSYDTFNGWGVYIVH